MLLRHRPRKIAKVAVPRPPPNRRSPLHRRLHRHLRRRRRLLRIVAGDASDLSLGDGAIGAERRLAECVELPRSDRPLLAESVERRALPLIRLIAGCGLRRSFV